MTNTMKQIIALLTAVSDALYNFQGTKFEELDALITDAETYTNEAIKLLDDIKEEGHS